MGAGRDVVNIPEAVFLTAQYNHYHLLYSRETGLGLGATLNVERRGFSAGLGLVYLQNRTEVSGTHLNFLLTLDHCWRNVCASIKHISHGSKLGIERHKENASFNILTIERRFQ